MPARAGQAATLRRSAALGSGVSLRHVSCAASVCGEAPRRVQGGPLAWKPIAKPALETGAWRVLPNLVDYARARREFTWEAAARALQGLPDGRGLNLAH